jgi:hypothetical protein
MATQTRTRLQPESFILKEPITLEELYDLMMLNESAFPDKFKLQKGLLGKSIVFPVFLNIQPIITVKDTKVKVSYVEKSTSVGVGGAGIDIKAAKQALQAAKEGGLIKAVTGGAEKYQQVIDAIHELLQSRM